MSKQDKIKLPKGLIIYLIIVPVFLLFICLIATTSGSKINFSSFFSLVLLLDGIPLLIYLSIYIIPWDKLKEKNYLKYIAVSIIIIFVIGICSCNTCSGSKDKDGGRCRVCGTHTNYTYKAGGYLCYSCYNKYYK